MTIIVGIDTEYVREADDEGEVGVPSAGNHVLSYQVWIIDTETGKQDGAVIHTTGPTARHRLSFTGFLSRALHAAHKEGILSEIPERIVVAAHFTRADTCGFSDWPKFKRQVSAVRGTYVTTKKPIVRSLRINNRPRKIIITLLDTMLLAPAGQQSLSALGELLCVDKVSPPDGMIERMDLLRETDPVLFNRYALRDAEIAALWVEKVLQFFRGDLNLDDNRIPATLGAAGVRMFKGQFGGGKLDELLGFEKIENGADRLRVPLPVIADHFAFFADCYHGARNEAYTAGYSEFGEIVDVDLAGAYTTAMAGIRTPDWKKTRATTDLKVLANVSALSFARVRFEFPQETRFPSLPVRAGIRGLIYPLTGTSYCTGAELVVAINLGATLTVEHGVLIPYANDDRPYAEFTRRINAIRSAYPKGSTLERMAKEIGNSLYGKTAQGVETMKARSDRGGGRRVFDTETGNMTTLPPSSITQPALAAFTTGLIRATLSEIISRLPRSRTVYTATTDGFLSDAPTSEIDLSGPAAKLFAELRRHVSESPDVVEVKHRVGRVLVTKTRGTITVEPGCLGKNGKAVLAKAGQRLEERYEDPWEECAAWEDLVRKRTFDTKGRHRAFIPLRPQWMNDADLVTQQRTARINLCYDLKRRPINVRDEKGIVAFDTEPWHSVEAFHTTRDAFEAWRASRRRVLRTSRDWKEFEEWKSSRRGRRESGVRGPRPRIVTLFMRAYARGELGLPGNAYKEAAEFLNEVGWKTTTTNIKDAKRRGQLILNSVTEFTPEELAFLEAVRKRWPAACLENLIVTPC